jgi:hypothetical protein
MKTKCMSCGGTMKKMQNGGSGQRKPVTRENIISRAMTDLGKSPNLPPLDSKYTKKRGTGLILKNKSKFPEGIYKPTMQNGGLITGAKKVAKQGPIKTIKTIRKALNKLTPRKTKPGCFGASCGKMQNGGMTPKCPGPNCPKRPLVGVTKAIKKIVKKTRTIGRNGTKQTDTPFGNFLKDPRVMEQPQPKKMQKGGVKK